MATQHHIAYRAMGPWKMFPKGPTVVLLGPRLTSSREGISSVLISFPWGPSLSLERSIYSPTSGYI